MEEEIITPEEEVFDYHKLRYILTNDGYIFHASFGGLVVCDLGECTEYNGEVPDGYSTIEEWHDGEIDKLNAWKIVEGNLVFDENKYDELQELCKIQEEENSNASHKWVREQLGKTTDIITDEFSNNSSGTSLVVLEDSGDYEIPELVLSSETIEEVNVVSSNKNLLGIDAVTQKLNGVDITIESDGSIKLNGTSTSEIELTLKGTSTSLDMLFLIQQDRDYVVSGLVDGVSLNLYNYDGTDRSLVGNYNNGVINLSSSNIVTQTTLKIASGTTLEDVVITPQIEVGSEVSTFVKHQEIRAAANSDETIKSLVSYSPTTIIMADKEVTINVTYFRYKYLNNKLAEIEVNEENIQSTVENINDNIEILNNAVETINSTMLTQTAEQFEMLFTQTGIQEAVDQLEGALNGNTDSLNTITEYIRFEGAEITLGKSTSQTKLIIRNDRISFMTGDTESAYISENTLYITDSTILNKMQVGRWETKEDEYGNLNTKWVGGE